MYLRRDYCKGRIQQYSFVKQHENGHMHTHAKMVKEFLKQNELNANVKPK